jgi:hypothetical protein
VLAVAVRDSYGSLNAQSVLRGLQRCAAQGEDQVRMAETAGGAGIGLYMIYQYADQLVINLRPGFATEFIAIVELGLKQRDRRTSGRCLNLFTTIDQRSSETAV